MNTMRITDIDGKQCIVDIDRKKIYKYSNKNSRAEWNAPIIEDGIHDTGFWTNFITSEKIDDIETRCNTWNNALILSYANTVNFNSKKYDPDREIWKILIKYVKIHQEDFFDKYGDWLPDLQISEDMIRKWIK